MIIGIGTDIASISRIERAVERFGDRFVNRVFTEKEVSYCKDKKEQAAHLAARFAAKEAVLKAFGTGLSNGISFKDLEVVGNQGRPGIRLYGKGAALAENIKAGKIHLSLSHDSGFALAFVVIESKNCA